MTVLGAEGGGNVGVALGGGRIDVGGRAAAGAAKGADRDGADGQGLAEEVELGPGGKAVDIDVGAEAEVREGAGHGGFEGVETVQVDDGDGVHHGGDGGADVGEFVVLCRDDADAALGGGAGEGGEKVLGGGAARLSVEVGGEEGFAGALDHERGGGLEAGGERGQGLVAGEHEEVGLGERGGVGRVEWGGAECEGPAPVLVEAGLGEGHCLQGFGAEAFDGVAVEVGDGWHEAWWHGPGVLADVFRGWAGRSEEGCVQCAAGLAEGVEDLISGPGRVDRGEAGGVGAGFHGGEDSQGLKDRPRWDGECRVMAEAVAFGVVERHHGAGELHQRAVRAARADVGRIEGFGFGLDVPGFLMEGAEEEAVVQRGFDPRDLGAERLGVGGVVEREARLGQEGPEGAGDDAGVAFEVGGVDLVEGVVGCVPPPAECVAKGAGAALLLADAAEHGWDADAAEGHVAVPAGAAGLVGRVGFGGDGLGGDGGEFGAGGAVAEFGCADAAGGVDVDVGGAAAFELVPVGVGVPCGAGVAAVGVPGPEAKAERSVPFRTVCGEDAGAFEHGRVGGAVVHDAEVPGVVVAGEEDEGVAGRGDVVRGVHVGDEEGGLAPSGLDLGVQGDLDRIAGGEPGAQGGAVGPGDRAGDGLGELGDGGAAGAAPHGGDAHFVKVVVGADVELGGGVGAGGAGCDGWACDAVDEEDAAAEVSAGEVGVAPLAEVGDGGGEALGGRGEGEAVCDGGDGEAVEEDLSGAGETDVGVVDEEGRAVAAVIEGGLDVAQAGEFVGRAGDLHVVGEGGAVGHEGFAADEVHGWWRVHGMILGGRTVEGGSPGSTILRWACGGLGGRDRLRLVGVVACCVWWLCCACRCGPRGFGRRSR